MTNDFLHYIQLPFVMFCILSIQAMSLQIIMGGAGLLSLGHAAFYTIGGYSSAIFTIFIAPKIGMENSFLLLISACIVGMLASIIFSFLIAIPCMKLKGDYLAMATLGIGEIVITVFKNLDIVGGTRGLKDIPKLGSPFIILIVLALVFIILKKIYQSNFGFAMQATRDDEISAKSLGINTHQIKIFAFLLGTALAGLSGVFYAHTLQFISPEEASLSNSISIILAVVIGGMYRIEGSILGALILVAIPEGLRFLPQLFDPYLLNMHHQGYVSETFVRIVHSIFLNRTLFLSLLVLLMMIKKPKGLISLISNKKMEKK